MYFVNDINKMCIYNAMGSILRGKQFNNTIENDILRNSSQIIGVSWKVIFEGLGVQMTPRHPAG